MKKSIFLMLMPLFSICATMNEAKAEDSVFTVTSFIPERFRDFEWRIEGSGNTSRNEEDRIGLDPWNEYNEWQSIARELTRDRYGFSTGLLYNYSSIPRYYTLSLLTGLSISENTGSEKQENRQIGYPLISERRESRSTLYWLDAHPSLKGGIYFFGDLIGEGSFDFLLRRQWTSGAISRNNYELLTIYSEDPEYLYHRKVQSETLTEIDQADFYIDASVTLGWGRKYDARFAATTLFLIEELRINGLLDREPTIEELTRLTEIIYLNRLKHVIDSRIRLMESLEEIIGFLKNEGLLVSERPLGYLLVQDVWQYFPNSTRYFGWRVSAGVRDQYGYLKETRNEIGSRIETITIYHPDSSGISDSIITQYTRSGRHHEWKREWNFFSIIANLEYYRPLNLQWQLEGYITGEYFLSQWAERSTKQTWDKSYKAAVSGALRYIMDSRSNLAIESSARYSTVREKPANKTNEDWEVTNGIRLSYRLAIPTSLNVLVAYTLGERNTDRVNDDFENDYNGFHIGISLTHFLF